MKNANIISTNPADRNVALYFCIRVSGTSIFIYCAKDMALRVFNLIGTSMPEAEIEAFGYHTDPETHKRLADAGKTEDPWALTLEFGTFAEFDMYCADRPTLERLGKLLTRETVLQDKLMPVTKAKLNRFARVRFVYNRGVETVSFADVPYTNIDPADWV